MNLCDISTYKKDVDDAVKFHPRKSAEMLRDITVLEHLDDVALYHHEKSDGSFSFLRKQRFRLFLMHLVILRNVSF